MPQLLHKCASSVSQSSSNKWLRGGGGGLHHRQSSGTVTRQKAVGDKSIVFYFFIIFIYMCLFIMQYFHLIMRPRTVNEGMIFGESSPDEKYLVISEAHTVQVVSSQPITAQRGIMSEHSTSLEG